MARTGRRPGDGAGTRERILAAARGRFAEDGYAGATIRAIARESGVDPALVHHYFGTKRALFVAALGLPLDPERVVAAILDGPVEAVGERLVRTFLTVWDPPPGRQRMTALVRNAVTEDHAARMLREFVFETVLVPVAGAVAPGDVPLRATLVGSQMVGLGLVRYVLGVEPLATAGAAAVEAALAPTVQRYLTGDLARLTPGARQRQPADRP